MAVQLLDAGGGPCCSCSMRADKPIKLDALQTARFWSNVCIPKRGPASINICWLWEGDKAGGRTGKAYGYFKLKSPRRTEYAQRIALTLFLGRQLEAGKYVLHRCNTGLCVNPKHLYEGTQKDNMADFREAGGDFRRTALLTVEQVTAIKRQLRKGGVRHEDIGKLYGVGRTTISVINSGRNWKDVP